MRAVRAAVAAVVVASVVGCGARPDVVRSAGGPVQPAVTPTATASSVPGPDGSAVLEPASPPPLAPAAVVATDVPPSSVAPPTAAPSPVGRWTAVARTRADAPWPLLDGTALEVEVEPAVVRWRAGCNAAGADLEITQDRLLVGPAAGTAMGCAEALHAQDAEVGAFFGASPSWRLAGDELVLAAGDVVVRLRRS